MISITFSIKEKTSINRSGKQFNNVYDEPDPLGQRTYCAQYPLGGRITAGLLKKGLI